MATSTGFAVVGVAVRAVECVLRVARFKARFTIHVF